MSKFFKLFVFLGGLFLVLQISFINNVSAQEEIPITTKSEKARKLFLEGRGYFEQLSSVEKEKELFLKATEIDPGFAFAYFYSAWSSASAVELQNYIEQANGLTAKVSEGERLLIKAFYAKWVKNNSVEQLALLEQLIQKYPKDKRVRWFLGLAYGLSDEGDKSIAQYKKAIEIDNEYGFAYNTLGYAYYGKNDFTKAEEAFKNYIRLSPNLANPHDSIADMYTRMGEHEKAIKHYKKALELDAKFAMSQRKIGTNLIYLEKYEKGRQAYRNALELRTTPLDKAYDVVMIAISYVYEEKYNLALDEFDQALKIAIESNLYEIHTDIHSYKNRIYAETGDFDAAKKGVVEYKNAVMKSGLSNAFKEDLKKDVFFDESIIAAKEKKYEKARVKAEEYMARIKPETKQKDLENYYSLLGIICFEETNYEKSIKHLNQANQENPYTLYLLAVSEAKVGDKKKATELFKKIANWNRNGINYALVRNKAIAMVEKEAIKDVIIKQIENYYGRNYEVYKDVWAHEPFIVRMNSGGFRHASWDSVGTMYKKEMEDYPVIFKDFKYNVSDMHIHVNGNSAWAIHNQTVDGIWRGTPYSSKGWNVRVLEKIDGKWKITFHMNGSLSPDNFAAIESRINILGYQLVNLNKYKEAIKVFKLNVEYFPDSWNCYDSLAEAYMKDGNKKLAIKNYEKSIKLNPKNESAKEYIMKLKAK
jgi:tetratricopeptide (TPR) repeat protein